MISAIDKFHARILWVLLAMVVTAHAFTPLLCIKFAPPGSYTDLKLYKDIYAAMVQGRGYYEAAVSLQRLHGYPLKPFVTVRLPLWQELALIFGWFALWVALGAIATASVFMWLMMWSSETKIVEAFLIPAVAIAAYANLFAFDNMPIVEIGAGVLMAAAIVMRTWKRDFWALCWAPAMLALLLREHVLPFHALAFVFAVYHKRWSEALTWLVGMMAFAGYLSWHSAHVDALLIAGDRHSQGWLGLNGAQMFVASFVNTGIWLKLPKWIGASIAFLPLIGWMAARGEQGVFMPLLALGYIVIFMVFCRTDTFYWFMLIQPWYTMGLVLAPRALWDLLKIAEWVPQRWRATSSI